MVNFIAALEFDLWRNGPIEGNYLSVWSSAML